MRISQIDVSIEKQLLTGMIVSDSFLKRMAAVYRPEYVDVEAVRLVAKWALDYHAKYGKAPGAMIQDIFKDKGRSLKEAEAEWIGELLSKLSGEYERLGFNEQYLFDRAVQYFRRQKLEKSSKKVLELLEREKLEEAEDIWLNSMRVAEADDLGFDPFDEKQALELMASDREARVKFRYGAKALDSILGTLKSGWLVIMMGPTKRGKTSGLTYTGIRTWLSGLNTVFISLESGDEDTGKRFWMDLGSLVTEDEELNFPEFVNSKSKEVEYVKQRRPLVSRGSVVKLIRGISKRKREKLGRLRVKTFPAFSAGVDDVARYLETLEVYEDFTPHVIIVDYLGAMTAPSGYKGRDTYDYNTKKLKGLAMEKKALVFTGHQGTKKALDELTTLKGKDVPEDIRILAHVDVMMALNQTEDEKEDGLMRINVVAHRWRRFNPYRQALVLQQLEAGQFYLDGRNIKAPSGNKKSKKEE